MTRIPFMNLENVPTARLEAEIDRRKKAIVKEAPPKPLEDISWIAVKNYAELYIEGIKNYTCNADEMESTIFESVMQAVYGNNVWVWINKHIK